MTMQQLQVFNNTEFGELGVIEIGGKPYFPATRCAEVLGYSNPWKAVSDHCRDLTKREVIDNLGRPQATNLIPEGDLYRLIVRSKLPAAERFERWVFEEVLPSIRKHGLYAIDDILSNPDLAIKALQALKAERAKAAALAERAAVQEQQIAEMRPKAGYYDVVLACKNAVPMRVIAKDYGWSAQRMNTFLHDSGIQYKQGGVWLLYQNHAENGYTDTRTHVHAGRDGEPKSTIHTYWTQKGRLFIYEKMKSSGNLPLIERCAMA
jgi:prophage antirepressor-like protein